MRSINNRNLESSKALKLSTVLLLPLLLIGLAGCSGGSNNANSQTSTTVNATYSKGPVTGATATLRDSDNNIVAGPVTTVNGNASFENVTYNGPVYASFTGGSYTDEATGTVVTLAADFVIRSGVIDNSASGTLDIIATPLTEIAFQRAENAATGNLDLSTVNTFIDTVADEFGLDGINLTEVAPTPLESISGISENDRYGVVLAAITQQLLNASIPPTSSALDDYISDNVTTVDEGALSTSVNDLLTNANTSAFIDNSIVSTVNSDIGRRYTVSGSISGLNGTIVLRNSVSESNHDDLTLTENGNFTFVVPVNDSTNYYVSVSTQPEGQTCTISNGSGTISAADINSVSVSCADHSTDSSLSAMSLSALTLDQTFQSSQTSYTSTVTFGVTSTRLTPTTTDTNATITVNGNAVANGSSSGVIALSTGANQISVIVTAENSTTTTYTITVTRESASGGLAQQAYIKASNTDAGDSFGSRVSLFGDTLAVSSIGERSGVLGDEEDDGLVSSGAVYVYTKNGSGDWSQQAYLKASNFAQQHLPVYFGSGFKFGQSLALAQDTLVVGAPGESGLSPGINGDQTNILHGNEIGAAYVFTRSGSTWTQQAYIKPSYISSGALKFGTSVALSDDGNTLVVGTPYEHGVSTGINGVENNQTGGFIGAVWVYTRTGSTWTKQAYIKASISVGYFGGSVGLTDDGNTLAVSSGETVHLLTRSGTTWSYQDLVRASNRESNTFDGFGTLSISGDTLAVGAYSEDSTASGIDGDQGNGSTIYGTTYNSGAAYIFTRDGSGAWSQDSYIKASNPSQGALFGSTLSLSNNGDSLLVGAYQNTSGSSGVDADQTINGPTAISGAAYLFSRSSGAWTQQHFIKSSNSEFQDAFGLAVALDDNGTMVVGASGEDSQATGVNGDQGDNSASGAGAVYVFE